MKTIDQLCQESWLPPLKIKWKTTLPIIQWGMGVGVSNWNLAGAVAREWWIGTLSSIWLSWIAPYKRSILNGLIKREKAVKKLTWADTEKLFHDASLMAALMEIKKAREISNWNGALWLNTMVAITDYKRHVELACQTGLNGIVSWAGLPRDLPNISKDYPNAALIPILSNLRWTKILLKMWERLKQIPDAIVLEDPTRAGGHLGASNLWSFAEDDIKNSTLEVAVPEVREFLEKEWLGKTIPVIAAWGIVTHEDVKRVLWYGAWWVQLWTRFLASNESGANTESKQAVLDAKWEDDLTRYMSNAGLPALALSASGVLPRIRNTEVKVRTCMQNCLRQCAYRDGVATAANGDPLAQMCILEELAHTVDEAGWSKWLVFVGVSALRIHTLLSVRQIMQELLWLSV